MNHREIGNGWATWSHGYTGDVYYNNGDNNITMTMPAGTGAFYFYAEPDPFETFSITATADDGTITIPVTGSAGANGFGFWTAGTRSRRSRSPRARLRHRRVRDRPGRPDPRRRGPPGPGGLMVPPSPVSLWPRGPVLNASFSPGHTGPDPHRVQRPARHRGRGRPPAARKLGCHRITQHPACRRQGNKGKSMTLHVSDEEYRLPQD